MALQAAIASLNQHSILPLGHDEARALNDSSYNDIDDCSQDNAATRQETETRCGETESEKPRLNERATPTPPTSKVPESVSRKRHPVRASARVPTRTADNTPRNDPVPKYASNVAAVLSLYGDGFIEIPTVDSTELRDGFSLAMRVFKAADVESHASQGCVTTANLCACTVGLSTELLRPDNPPPRS